MRDGNPRGEDATERVPVSRTSTTRKSAPVKVISHSRFNGGVATKRKHGSSIVTVFLALTASGAFGDGPGILVCVAGPNAATRGASARRIASDVLAGASPVARWIEIGFVGFGCDRGRELAAGPLRSRLELACQAVRDFDAATDTLALGLTHEALMRLLRERELPRSNLVQERTGAQSALNFVLNKVAGVGP